MRYQSLHRSGELEPALLPIWELKTEGSGAGLGAEGASLGEIPVLVHMALGSRFLVT